jgi:uncharacterized protein YecT (DUF1311 family)
MRLIFLGALLALVAADAFADDVRPSQALCDTTKFAGRELADCLRANADKSNNELGAVFEAAIKSIDSRPGLLKSQKARWHRSLADSQAQWLSWRDTECQDVAPFEAGMGAKGGDPGLICIIDQDTRRIADLKAHYP